MTTCKNVSIHEFVTDVLGCSLLDEGKVSPDFHWRAEPGEKTYAVFEGLQMRVRTYRLTNIASMEHNEFVGSVAWAYEGEPLTRDHFSSTLAPEKVHAHLLQAILNYSAK